MFLEVIASSDSSAVVTKGDDSSAASTDSVSATTIGSSLSIQRNPKAKNKTKQEVAAMPTDNRRESIWNFQNDSAFSQT